jgi:hypothetical protein
MGEFKSMSNCHRIFNVGMHSHGNRGNENGNRGNEKINYPADNLLAHFKR